VAPIVAAWLTVRLASQWFVGADGWSGVALWLVQAIPVAATTSIVIDRFTRRLLPLATLLSLSLAFPDRAPSKFAVALRAGSPRRLQHRISELRTDGLGSDAGQAAAKALELVAALSMHDRRTRGHTERVRAYADLIAEELELPEANRLRLAWGVMLHDVGKLTVPPEILNKAEPLTKTEWEILRGHPEASGRILEPMAEWLGPWVLAGAQHHERWDGAGYPFGLAGEEISLAGRITAVADAYDVVTSKRSYKESMSAEAARRELVRCAGTQFDPVVVRAFLNASVGQRRTAGPWGWLPEFRSLGQIGSGLSTAGTTVAAAGASTLAVVAGAAPIPDIGRPESMAYVEAIAPLESSPVDMGLRSMVIEPLDTPAVGTTTEPTVTAEAPTTTSTTATTSTSASTPTSATITTSPAPSSSSTSSTSSTTSSTTSTTTTVPSTSLDPPDQFSWSLGSGGHTSSQPILPLDGSPIPGPLPNYDTDRDDDPGLLLAKGSGLSEIDENKTQRWGLEPGNVILTGVPTLTLRAAVKGFDTTANGVVLAGLYDCDLTYADCSKVSSSAGQIDSSGTGGTDFGVATLVFDSIDHSFATDRTLVLKVTTGVRTGDALWLAYGTEAYDSMLSIE
jgi:hypothetical protein